MKGGKTWTIAKKMCEGLSSIVNGPISPHPMFLRENTFLEIKSSRSHKSFCEGPSKISGPIVSHYGDETDRGR